MTTQTESIAIVGAGISGMCTALALAKRGHQVTLFERDIAPPAGDADQAFFEWQRRGAAQFRHPHAFLGLMCSILEEQHPELLEAFFAAGARRVDFADMVPPNLLDQYQPEPDDRKLWVLMCRRATIETTLRRHVESLANIEIRNTTYVTDLVTEQRNGVLVATGLELTDRQNGNEKSIFPADVIVDAAGRASKFPRWLTREGIAIAEQRDDAEIVYYTRHYRLADGVAEPSRHSEHRGAGDLGYLKYGVFPGDNGHFALILCLPNEEIELREAIKNGANFDAVCRTIPGLERWLVNAEATTPPFGIGEIHAVWRSLLANDQAQLLNFFAVGDACVRTNPLYGRGCSTGILHAHLLADVLGEHDDPQQRVEQFETLTAQRLRPIFDASLRQDKSGIKRAAAVRAGESLARATSARQWLGLAFRDAVAAAARERIHVFRGMMRTVNLVENPGDFLRDPKTRFTVLRYMLRGRKRNAQARVEPGLSREDMLHYIGELSPE